jgi:hypothetical protein
MSEKFQKFVLSALGVLVMSILVSYLVFAWTEPTASPPGGNVPAPINVGPQGQLKEGGLMIATNPTLTTGLIVQYGNVGIGTTNPIGKLQVGAHIYDNNGDVSGWNTPRCSCDTSSYTRDCPDSWETSDPTGSVCYDQFTQFLNRRKSTKFVVVDKSDLIVTSNGNVGIGTTNPTQKLDVAGYVKGTGFCIGSDCRTSWPSQEKGIYVNYSNNCVAYPGGSPPSECIKQTGNVGQWLTIPDMVIERNFPASKLIISSYLSVHHWDCCTPCYAGYVRLLVDGNEVKRFATGGCESNWYNFEFHYVIEVSAGTHRIEVQWYTGENVGKMDFYTSGQRSLEVLVGE